MNRAGSLTLSRRSKATGTHIKKYEKYIPFDEGVNSLNISNGVAYLLSIFHLPESLFKKAYTLDDLSNAF